MTDTPPAATPAATTLEPTDTELERLKLERAKQTLRQEIAATQASALEGLAPGISDAPKGEVTLGEKAGSLGSWLAHRVLAEAGVEIAATVRDLGLPGNSVVLVTDDADLLVSDVLSRQVLAMMAARTTELGKVRPQVSTAFTTLEADIARYSEMETPPAPGADDGVEEQVRILEGLLETPAVVAAMAIANDNAAEDKDKDGSDAGAEGKERGDAAAADDARAGQGGGPIGAAVDLVRLLATDFTLTSAAVSVRSATLAVVTAGALAEKLAVPAQQPGQQPPQAPAQQPAQKPAQQPAAPNRYVVLDGLTVAAANSPTLHNYASLTRAAYETSLEIQKLQSKAAAVAAEATEYKGAADKLQNAWTAATTSKEAAAGGAGKLKAALDEITIRVTRRTSAASAAQTAAESAMAVVSAARADLTALTTPDAKGVMPLVRTCSREGLHQDPATVTHVLQVEATNAGADVVTRRSVLGSSGRVSYLAGTNAAWALAEVATGHLRAGGAKYPARQMTHDLTSGKSIEAVIAAGADLGDDPLYKNETWVRIGVLILAFGVALLGVAAVVNVVGSLF